jgi:molybdopterin-containing oxidoreductase family membrane subunit
MIFCNVVVPQTFWWKKARTNVAWLWIASILVGVGMWAERFVIIVISLYRDFLPSSWHLYAPTWVDWSIFVGTLSFFSLLFLLFLRFLPAVAISEVKELNHEMQHHDAGGHA